MVLLTTAGFQVPGTPLVELLGSAGTEPPVQIVNEVPKAKVGVFLGFTTMVFVTGKPHCPPLGVNV